MIAAWLIRSPLGVLWRAVSLDERRVSFLGFDPNHLKAIAFGVSGLFGGVAGTLYAPENNLVTPDLFGFALSTNFVVWVAIGGRSTLYGPVLGAVGLGVLTAALRDTISYWEAILAIVFIVSVLYFKNGIMGWIEPAIVRRFFARGPRNVTVPSRRVTTRLSNLAISKLNLQVGQVSLPASRGRLRFLAR